MMFINFLNLLKPANQNLNWMDVKEKSEYMDAAKAKATEAVKEFFLAQKDYDRACDAYEQQLRDHVKKRGF